MTSPNWKIRVVGEEPDTIQPLIFLKFLGHTIYVYRQLLQHRRQGHVHLSQFLTLLTTGQTRHVQTYEVTC